MDNPEEKNVQQQLLAIISQQVHHELDHFTSSPTLINRVVGESMRHIGTMMQLNSSAYLPVRPEETLVKPEPMTGSLDGVMLLTRQITGAENGFLVMANCKTIADGQRRIELTAFRMDTHNLSQSRFMQLSPAIGNEIIRQLNMIAKGDGNLMVQVVMIKDYFKTLPQDGQSELFSSDTQAGGTDSTASAPAAATSAPAAPAPAPVGTASGGLPPVMDTADLL